MLLVRIIGPPSSRRLTSSNSPDDSANRLEYTGKGEFNGNPPEPIARYDYNGDGLRVTKALWSSGDTTYLTPIRYINDVAVANPTILDDGTYRYIWAGGTLLYAVKKTDSSYLVSRSDGQGTLLSQTDGAGQVVTIYANDVSGQVEADDGGYGYAEPEVFPIRYAGEQYDAESDLIYLRARYMDPLSGRFMSRDT